jgi:malonyl-CoA O-methyltransferase
MADERPPTIAPAAAERWQRVAPPHSPWLHEEVARRMQDRLEWIKRAPATWASWEPVRGGLQGHALVAKRYPQARCHVVEDEGRLAVARQALTPPWWRRLAAPAVSFDPPAGVEMVWANMLLHMAADPQALLARWQRALAVDGFLMFSCLGPDTLRELRELYAALGWAPPCHAFTDMHDWGDMLVAGGFAEPVMDMERITLTFETPRRLLEELRELGRNLHGERHPALRGRGWRQRLEQAIDQHMRGPQGQLALTFEIIYGHALKPVPRAKMGERSAVSLDDMRAMLQADRRAPR